LKRYVLIINLLLSSVLLAQYDLSAGMGLNFFSSPDLRDYINSNFSSSSDISSFSTSADFFVEIAYAINEDYQIAVDYTYNIYSFNSNFGAGNYDLQLKQHKPSIIGYYVIAGTGYKLKIGTGFGLRLANADEKLYGMIENYNTSGIGFLFKGQGDTKLGGNFYALIAGEIRYDLPGEINTLSGGLFNVNSISVSLKLGTVFYF